MWIGDIIRMKYVGAHLPEWKGEGKGKLLDLCAGEGIYRQLIETKGYEYGAIDTEQRAPFPVTIADARKIPFQNNFFDVIICVDGIEHIKEDDVVIKEIYRVLKKGGICLLHTPNKDQQHIIIQPEPNVDHVRDGYTKQELALLFSDFEGKIIPTFNEIETIGWELAYFNLRGIKFNADEAIIKLLNFNKKFENLGWLCIAKK